ncbi:MAG TPA: flavin-dependent oxidoreductase [Pseudolabrys sp.]|nr:flavin-dependent oxidoreductase [Pseudolabrys sp.]
MKAIIIGGGVGGLTTALMCHARGIDCEIYEQSDTIRELGVGINTLPHAIKELKDLGLLERLDAVAIRTYELFYANRFGQTVWHELRGTDAGFEVPQFSIHRGRLQGVLYQAARARLGETRIFTGHRLGHFMQDESGVSAYFFDRQGRHIRTARGDVLIGADGIHSFVRARLFPQESPAIWNGTILWRGAVDWPQFMTGRSMIIAGGMEAKFVLYPIAEGSAPDRRLTNWAVMAKVAAGGTTPRKEDWSRQGRWDDLRPYVQKFNLPFLDVSHLIEASGEFWEYPLCDREPLPRWSHGRVTLLGDAAHPMYPVGSNGASQAILDARCLADKLLTADNAMHALWQYDQERLPMTTQIVLMNRKGGPEGVIDAIEARAPDGFQNIDDVLSYEERKAIVRGYASTAGFAKTQVNKAA